MNLDAQCTRTRLLLLLWLRRLIVWLNDQHLQKE
jgi:hypothetical protein